MSNVQVSHCTSRAYLQSEEEKSYSTVKKQSSMQVEAAVPFPKLISSNIKQIVISRLQLKKTYIQSNTPRGFRRRELVKTSKTAIQCYCLSVSFYIKKKKSTRCVYLQGSSKVLEGSSPQFSEYKSQFHHSKPTTLCLTAAR